jgi:phosphatidylethanolamine N-methyltransferase
MLIILIVPCLFIASFAQAWAYLKPESFTEKFTQEQLIICISACYCIALLSYLIMGFKNGFNKAGLWLAVPIFSLGVYLTLSSSTKIGVDRVFFGKELGTVKDADKITTFPFSLGHCMYKGGILIIFALWLVFSPSHELTATTGIWIVQLLVQMFIESPCADTSE